MINKKLYQFLLERGYASRNQIASNLNEFYPRGIEDSSDANSSAFRQMRRDVYDINLSDANKLIVFKNDGYAIATEAEADKLLNQFWMSAMKKLKMYYSLRKKIAKDGQAKFENEDALIGIINGFLEADNGN